MSGKQKPETLDGELMPAPKPPPKIDLRNASAIRRELAAVYRDMRSGAIEAGDGTKCAYVLNLLGQAYERDVLEQRLEQLEKANENEH